MELKQTVLNTQDLNFWFLSDVGFYFGRLIKDLVTLVFLRTIGRWFVHGQLDIGFSTDNWTWLIIGFRILVFRISDRILDLKEKKKLTDTGFFGFSGYWISTQVVLGYWTD